MINFLLTFSHNKQIINLDFYDKVFAEKYKDTMINFGLNKSLRM